MSEQAKDNPGRSPWADLAARGQKIADTISKKYPSTEVAQALETFRKTVENELEKMPSRTREATTKVLQTVTNIVDTFADVSVLESKRPETSSTIYAHGARYFEPTGSYRKAAGRSTIAGGSTGAERRFIKTILAD